MVFSSSDEVYAAAQRYLRSLTVDYLVHEFEKLIEHCKLVILNKGEYIVDTVK